ncbi:putative mitochondrial folylpolyglutamate synthetase (FPGS) [Leptomonas pyrrhocoris]|uniref:tetrahydrofolate synthase n=2 Tax=Leptomonas pyrrhocoris TaxID=157538 RepID=A0A0M9G322_LEPPY|nr:putative mitochondrial folylpolyglutamate synthetase (FPGS) [Leptomonas pyrrhocoris]XP_015659656.1 putative mitochondrial folylpolyglutamate synthetase (FPGS) [Leptomonas pyrrhocoris]KPA81216.1 putative mitochondrial folylpolyglutamate synthetase (FPGS) [Leptomonas pyrrhocoris]KPA81217.1 putative mitochondrial folylpolyglutamate synthetase (FPGS) [Leptomonas pyrrhocoris]|eukprot:XP_015659655.1 putative mitochondrial folylpolyglutamate synthetase (FPGS) [Leptomonas pyrrhocoris]
MSAATLHAGVQRNGMPANLPVNGTGKPPQQPHVVVHNLGEGGDAGVGAEGVGRAAVAGDFPAPPQQHRRRSFQDAVDVVTKMTSRKPNKCPDAFEVTKRFLDRLGFAPILERIRFVHVAGTKGKGTTSAYTAALLQAYGFKVGLFTSPHLTDLRERTVVDGRLLDEATYARYFFEFLDKYEALQFSNSQLDRDIAAPSRANFFRFMFLFSLYVFEQENVAVAVMEVGLGGRLDSTNTVPAEVSVITALGYDHMEILGNTIQEIASEKAGIMKPGVVCFAAPQVDHPETRQVLEKHAKEVDAPLILLDKDVLPIRSWPRLAIGGIHAVEDSKLALMAARRVANIPLILPLDEVEKSVLQTMTYAGRSQIVPIDGGADTTLYLDGAHTPESIAGATEWFLEASAATTKDAAPRRVLVFYTSRNPKRILKAFMPYVSKFCKVVVAQIANPRMSSHSADPGDVDGRMSQSREEMVTTTECWRSMYREVPCLPCASPFDALEDILDLVVPAASDGEDASKPAQVFVCGSFYLVGDIVKLARTYEAGERRRE